MKNRQAAIIRQRLKDQHTGGYSIDAFKEEFYEFEEVRRSENGRVIFFTHREFKGLDFSVTLTVNDWITEDEHDRVHNLIFPKWSRAKKHPVKFQKSSPTVSEEIEFDPEQHFTVRIDDKPYGVTVHSKGDAITLFRTDIPFVRHRFTHDKTIDALAEHERKAAQSQEFQRHIEMLQEGIIGLDTMRDIWTNRLGGSVDRTEHAMAFAHPLLKEPKRITPDSPLAPDTINHFMTEASAALFERQAFRLNRMRKLEERGYSVRINRETHPPCVNVSREDPAFTLRTFPLNTEGEVFLSDPKREIEELERLHVRKTDLEKLRQKREAADRRAQKNAARAAAKEPKPIQQAIYVLDATVLARLSHARGKPNNKRTWLDIIRALEALPSTKYVIVPSIVADWELLGRMPLNRDKRDPESRLKQIETRENVIDKWRIPARDEFFKHAHRLALMPDGSQEWIHPLHGKPEDSKLVVWESQQQHEFYDGMMREIHTYQQKRHIRNPVVIVRQALGKDAGELACMRIAQSIDDRHCPVFVISDDESFLYIYKARLKTGNIHTYGDRAIGVLGTPQLIKRLCIAHEDDLSGPLHKISEVPEERIGAEGVFEDINAQCEEQSERPLRTENQLDEVVAVKPDGTREPSLLKILKDGVQEQQRLEAEAAKTSEEKPKQAELGPHTRRHGSTSHGNRRHKRNH